ncbi:MAG: DUF4956 domain-containing protein [Verrucomicrobia bacterium]|nr:DUF4956 domain-containing protein [Verrucomicrobiota bacterium]
MPDWLISSFQTTSTPTVGELFWRLGGAFIVGLAVAGIYRATRGHEAVPTFPPTLVLLSILIAMVTQVIGDNVARAFSLVGALSIVRFRTVVRDTQDTAFVIFAVVVGMAVGANYFVLALIGLSVVGIAAALTRPKSSPKDWSNVDCVVEIRMEAHEGPGEILQEVFDEALEFYEMLSVGTAQKGEAVDISYRVRLKKGVLPAAFVAQLNALEPVQRVDFRRSSDTN